MTKSGIYQIKNLVNGKIYVGSSVNLKKRKREHFNLLKNNKHENKCLQNSYNKHGFENFEFEIIEYIENENNLIEREQHYIDILAPEYNISKVAGSPMTGLKHSEETKKKISESNKGKTHSEESKKKMSEAQKGRKFSKEHKKKLSEAKKNISEEEKKKLPLFQKGHKINLGKICSEETRQKLSEAHKGEKHGKAKLTENQVIEIKKLLKEGKLYQREIAEMFNISNMTISCIKTGKRWQHVKVA